MQKLIIYNDLEGTPLVLICTKEDFYNAVFKGEDSVEIVKEIDIEGDLSLFPTNRPLLVDF